MATKKTTGNGPSKRKVSPPKPRVAGTADTIARRAANTTGSGNWGAERFGIRNMPLPMTTPYGSFRTVESSTKKLNGGKRIVEKKKVKGIEQISTPSGTEGWEASRTYKTSDAIVAPTAKKSTPKKKVAVPRKTTSKKY